jgi:L,D-transpeptidase YbiS
MKVSRIDISVSQQLLRAVGLDDAAVEQVLEYPVATAKNGVGQQFGSECTPLGEHRIRAKIGQGYALNTVLVGRRPSAEIYSEALAIEHPTRDWILSRIMWLCGEQPTVNRGGSVDTMRRYIYIHGAPDSHPMGVPSSHGCIKMRNVDVIDLFDRVDVGTPVSINP